MGEIRNVLYAFAAIALIGSVMKIRELNESFEKEHDRVSKLEAAYTSFTNEYFQAHPQTNGAYTSEPTNSVLMLPLKGHSAMAERTPTAINYAEKLNQVQATQPR